MKRSFLYLILVNLVLLYSCTEDVGEKIDYGSLVNGTPSVTTGETITDNYGLTVTIGGSKVESGSPITDRGICYDAVNSDPKLYTTTETGYVANTVVSASKAGEGEFSISTPISLKAGQTYFYRAFAVNANGVTYGPVKTFKTNPLESVTGSFTSEFWEVEDEPIEVAHIEPLKLYVMIAMFESGYNILVKDNGDGTLTVSKQGAWTSSQYGLVSVDGAGTIDGKVIELTLEHTASAGSFGKGLHTIVLP